MSFQRKPKPIGIVAGSGIDLLPILDTIDSETPFAAVPGLATGGVEGHPGVFVQGRANGLPVVLQLGRLHCYEGHRYPAVTRTVDVMAEHGVTAVVFTNAAGGLIPAMTPGDLMAVKTIRLWPYRHWAHHPEVLHTHHIINGCDAAGAYLWIHGPTYETRAEIAAMRAIGAHAVGMSTAPELHRCHELAIKTAAISCITNNCCNPVKLTHAHVVETARKASQRLTNLLKQALPALATHNS